MHDDEEAGGYVGRAKAVLSTISLLPVMLLSPLFNVVPAAWRLYYKINRWSAYQMQKASRADAVANVRRSNGHEDLLPAAWSEGSEDDKDLTGWKVLGLGDKRYDSAVHGRNSSRFGKANMIHINEDDTEQGTWAEAAIDNALGLGREKYLFRDATVSVTQLVYEDGDPTKGAAVPDGGQATRQTRQQNVSVQRPGVLQDAVVPIGSREGYDGQMVSWTQYQNLKKEQSDQESVREAKNQAWSAAKLDSNQAKDLVKWGLMLAGWSALLLFHAEIGAAIASFGGGAVSGLGMIGADVALGVI